MVPKLFGLNNVINKTKKQRERLKDGATAHVRAHVSFALRELARNTPQWSGSLASSWYVDLHYRMTPEYKSPYPIEDDNAWMKIDERFKGDKRAVAAVMENNADLLKAIRWNAKVSIVNVHPLAGTFAIGNEADPEVKGLRKGNFIPGDIMAIKLVAQKMKAGYNVEALRLMEQMNYD